MAKIRHNLSPNIDFAFSLQSSFFVGVFKSCSAYYTHIDLLVRMFEKGRLAIEMIYLLKVNCTRAKKMCTWFNVGRNNVIMYRNDFTRITYHLLSKVRTLFLMNIPLSRQLSYITFWQSSGNMNPSKVVKLNFVYSTNLPTQCSF